MPFRLFLVTMLVSWLLLLPFSYTWAEEVEFDGNQLQKFEGTTPIDVSRFRFGNPIAAGEYTVDIYVNKKRRGEAVLRFIETQTNQTPISGLCLHREWLDMLDLLPEAVKLQPDTQNCIPAVHALPQIDLDFDTTTQRLNVSIPDALAVKRPRGYIAPSQWQNGIPAAFVHYSFHNRHNHQRQNNTRSQRRHLNIRTGVNWDGWALRHHGSYSNNDHSGYQRYETYLERDLDQFNSRITAGDFLTNSSWDSNIGLRGLMWSSDLRMLPPSQRGFAPTVRGTADSNATVSIRQNGNVIYQTEVAAGPFVIDDLYPSGGLGDLEVEVSEESGIVRRFTVPFSASSSLMRPGKVHFQAALGRYRENENVFKLPVFKGSLQYGINNHLTVNASLNGSKRHIDTQLSTVWHTPVGTLENNMQFSQLRQPANNRRLQSKSVGFNLYKNLPNSGTHFNFGFRHYFSPYHYSIRDAAHAEQNPQWQPTVTNNLKNRYQLSLNQMLGLKSGSLYINGISKQYYNQNGLHHEYQLGYSNQYKNLQYRLGYSQARSENNRRNNQFYFSLSMPLDTPKTHHTMLSADYYRTNGHNTTRLALNSSYEKKGSYGIAVTQQDNLRSYSAHAAYPTPWTKLNAHLGHSRRHNYFAYTLSGAWVAHPYGLTASSDLSDTFAVIHAKGASGASINGGNRLDRWGNGIVPHLTPYQVNKISINPEQLPDTVELNATGMELIPRANTTTLARFTTNHGKLVLFELEAKEAGQQLPPFGTEVTNSKGEIVGHVVQGNRALVRLNNDSDTLQIIWAQHSCRFPYHLQTADPPPKRAIMPNYTVQCQAIP